MEHTERVKIGGNWVTRAWSKMDEEASKQGSAISRVSGLVKRNCPKRPQTTQMVTGASLERARIRRGL